MSGAPEAAKGGAASFNGRAGGALGQAAPSTGRGGGILGAILGALVDAIAGGGKRNGQKDTDQFGQPLDEWGNPVSRPSNKTKVIEDTKKEDKVTLYRAVSRNEKRSIHQTGKFTPGPNSLEGKFFAHDPVHAEKWGRAMERQGFHVIEVDYSRQTFDKMEQWGRLDNIGPASYANPAIMNDFIGEIRDKGFRDGR